MHTRRFRGEADERTTPDDLATNLLDRDEERKLLRALAECKETLAEALAKVPGAAVPPEADGPMALSQYIAMTCGPDGPAGARLGAVYRRYSDLRSRLALANLRLVAHVAKRFKDRGVSYSDLIQEGFCGLLEAIDRFDLAHGTKLATYATWWIRQSMQRAVASGAYPVRLSPRHLRQLAQNQGVLDPGGRAPGGSPRGSTELIHRIHAATRPTVSLDAAMDPGSHFSLIQTMTTAEGDPTERVDTGETIGRLMGTLRPREREVLSLRFGLGGQPRMSLSQVGTVLSVSKERVRQIQDRALSKLRAEAGEHDLADALADL